MREKMDRKVRISVCCAGVARGGYVAARECRSVQVERPSVSTSGGQGKVAGLEKSSAGWGGGVVGGVGRVDLPAVADLEKERRSFKELHVLHLGREELQCQPCTVRLNPDRCTYGFPSGPRIIFRPSGPVTIFPSCRLPGGAAVVSSMDGSTREGVLSLLFVVDFDCAARMASSVSSTWNGRMSDMA